MMNTSNRVHELVDGCRVNMDDLSDQEIIGLHKFMVEVMES